MEPLRFSDIQILSVCDFFGASRTFSFRITLRIKAYRTILNDANYNRGAHELDFSIYNDYCWIEILHELSSDRGDSEGWVGSAGGCWRVTIAITFSIVFTVL